MKTYELMFIVPGTLTEEEVKPHVAAVEAAVQGIDATDMKTASLGKAKLAYPMRHIRYGYFYTTTFTAEPSRMPELQKQLNLQKDLLRTLVNEALTDEQTRDTTPDELITIEKKQDLIDERKKAFARYKEEQEPVAAAAPKKVEDAPVVEEATAEAPAEEKESMSKEDIDKKLDEIISGDDITENV